MLGCPCWNPSASLPAVFLGLFSFYFDYWLQKIVTTVNLIWCACWVCFIFYEYIYIHNSTALNPTLYQFCIKKHSVSNSVPPTGNVWKLQILEPQWINIRLSLELHFEIQIEWQFIGTFFSWWWWWWISLLGHAFHPTSIGLPHICTVCIWISCLRQQFSNNDTCLIFFFFANSSVTTGKM